MLGGGLRPGPGARTNWSKFESMKPLKQEQVEQGKAAIHTYMINLPEDQQSQLTISSLIKAIRVSSFPGMEDLTMSRGTFCKHFGTLREIRKRYSMEIRSENFPIEHREKIRDVFSEILSTLEPEQVLCITLKELRSIAIGRCPHLLIESKSLSTLRQYFQITELRRKALSSTSTGIAP